MPALSALALGAGTVLLARVVGTGLNYFLQILLARWAGPASYGAYSYAMAWTAVLSTLSGLGLPQAVVRFIPEYESTLRWSFLRGLVQRTEHLVGLASSALAILGIAGVIGLLPEARDSLVRVPLIVGFALIPARGLMNLQTRLCIARHQLRAAYVLPNLFRPLFMIGAAALIVLVLDAPLTATTIVVLASIPVVIVWLVQRWVFRRRLPAAYQDATAAHEVVHWLRAALPMLLITGFLLLLSHTDLLMIGMLADVQDVGLYKVATKTAGLVSFPLLAINAVAAPRFAALHATDDAHQLQHLVRIFAHWIFWPSVVIAMALFALSDRVLSLFGPAFVSARPTLFVLMLGHVVSAGTGSVGYLLNMTGHHNHAALIYGTCALGNIAFNAVGIYYLGMMGAAIATTLSMACWNVWLYRVVRSQLAVYPSIWDALRTTRRRATDSS